ncbi:MAG TPA: nodulation protein NfeD [Candidatus Kapabacteria bacterium]|nr:nodulation protein NfeD [Candidatus Kapabacteria bacterium]
MMKKICLLIFLLCPFLLNGEIFLLKIDGPIETITEEYVVDSFKEVKSALGAKLVIIQIDTPGGFDTSMRGIIKEILASPVPVAVYVSPRGARAGSAGFFITIAADIAAMAPGTNMGAAHPVSITGTQIEETMRKKVTNDAVSYAKSLANTRNRNEDLSGKAVEESRSYTAEECLKNTLVEYIAQDVENLLQQLEGKEIRMINGKTFTLKLKNEKIITLELSARQKFLKTISNPTLALVLLVFGLIALLIEFTHAGAIIPGVLGGISLLLAFLAFHILPINYVGLFLIILSIGFFIAEIKIQGFGAFGVGGIVSFVLGSMMLVNSPIPEMRPAMSMIIMLAILFGAVFMFLTYKVIQAMKLKTATGVEGMTGEIGEARTEITPSSGKVFVHAEWWNAVADETIPEGSKVVVESIHNFVMKVKRVS